MKYLVIGLMLMSTLAAANAQTGVPKTVDEYCITVSEIMDEADAKLDSMDFSSLPASEQPIVKRGFAAIKANHQTTRHDACVAPNLAAAIVAVTRDINNGQVIVNKQMAQAKANLAEMYRSKAKAQAK